MKLKNLIMEIRKAKTPPCTQCVHSRFKTFNSVYEEEELLKIADMRKRNPSDSAERRFFMLVEQALGAHQ